MYGVYLGANIEVNHNYRMEIAFPDLGFWAGETVKRDVIEKLYLSYDVVAKWSCPIGMTFWILDYHLESTSVKSFTHEEMFDNCMRACYDLAYCISYTDLGLREPFEKFVEATPEEAAEAAEEAIKLPLTKLLEEVEKIKKDPVAYAKENWKWLLAGGVVIFFLGIIFMRPYAVIASRTIPRGK